MYPFEIDFDIDYIFSDYVLESMDLLRYEPIDYNKLDELIKKNYESNDTDIEDLHDMLGLLNSYLFENLSGEINDKIMDKNKNLLKLRMTTKKYATKKYREGMMFLHPEMPKKYDDEKPREYFEVEFAYHQYHSLLEYEWKPSVEKYKGCLDKINNI